MAELMPIDLAFEVDQRPAAVARVDGGVGLQEVLVHVHVAGRCGPWR